MNTIAATAEPIDWRPWHPLRTRVDRFHWLLGLRATLAFVGPVAVAHVLGRGQADAAVMSLAGLVVVLIVGPAPRDRTRILTSAGLLFVLPLILLVDSVIAPHSAAGLALMAVAGVLAAFAVLISPHLALLGRAAGLGLVMAASVPASVHNAALMALGGVLALTVIGVTEVLAHPRLPLPGLPAGVRPPDLDVPAIRRHAARIGLSLGLGGLMILLVGQGSAFASHSTWMLLGVWIALRPHHHETRDLAVQRAVGTLAGGLITLALWVVVPHAWWIGWAFLAMTFVAFGLRSVNYAWYCVLLTPVVVIGLLGGELHGDVLAARIVWTVVGVAVAFAASLLVPRPRPTGG